MFRAIVAAVYIAGGQVVVPIGAPVPLRHHPTKSQQTQSQSLNDRRPSEKPIQRLDPGFRRDDGINIWASQQTRLFHFSPAKFTSKESLLVRLFRRWKTALSWNKYEQSNIKYDSVGRATSYHLKTTQIEH